MRVRRRYMLRAGWHFMRVTAFAGITNDSENGSKWVFVSKGSKIGRRCHEVNQSRSGLR
jgi:hypothetical protein